MSHVLGGDGKMRALAAQAHREHGNGTAQAGRPMLEEYAYFSDYSINYEGSSLRGSIENFGNVATGTPSSADWPSEEGYATSLLALLHTDNAGALTTTRSGDPEPIPLVQASSYSGARLSASGYTGDLTMNITASAPMTLIAELKRSPWSITLRSSRPKGVTHTYQSCIEVVTVNDSTKMTVAGYYWGEGLNGGTNRTSGNCDDIAISDTMVRRQDLFFAQANSANPSGRASHPAGASNQTCV